jgi:putative membrane protein
MLKNKEESEMTGYEFCEGYWWIFPVAMIIFCIFFMRRCAGRRLCGFGEYSSPDESAMDILNKRYAKGEIDQNEYEGKKRGLEAKNK